MQDNLFNLFNQQVKGMYAPMTKFNSLMVESVEKMTEFQLNTIRSYADIAINQMKQAAEIEDADDLREFTTAQTEVAKEVNKKVLEDAYVLSEMAADFRTKVEAIVSKNMSAATGSESESKPAATKATTTKKA